MFHGAAPADLAALEARAERRYYRPNQLIFQEGEPATALYLVEVGTVEIFRFMPALTVLLAVGSGGWFGDIAFFGGGKRMISARACEPSHVIAIPYHVLNRLFPQHPALALAFYCNGCRALSGRLQRVLLDLTFARECIAA